MTIESIMNDHQRCIGWDASQILRIEADFVDTLRRVKLEIQVDALCVQALADEDGYLVVKYGDGISIDVPIIVQTHPD
jgi:hypothetical protein